MDERESGLLAMGIIYVLGIFATYIFQYVKILRSESVESISGKFMIMGNVSSVCSLVNSLVFYFDVLLECFEIETIECLNKSLGLYQIATQFLCFVFLYGLYVWYYKQSYLQLPQYGSINFDHTVSRKIPYVFLAGMLFDAVMITLTGLLLWKLGITKEVITYARTMGILGTFTIMIQYLYQIFKLYMVKNSGVLSSATYALLSAGNFISFFYLVMTSQADVTTWLPYLVCLLLQLSLLSMILYYPNVPS